VSAGRLTSSDLIGSGTTTVSMKWHLGHSKVRFSEWSNRGTMLAKFIRVRHLMQGGRSIGESNTSVSERGMSLTSRLKLRLSYEGAFLLSGCRQKLRGDFLKTGERLSASKVRRARGFAAAGFSGLLHGSGRYCLGGNQPELRGSGLGVSRVFLATMATK